MGTDDMTELKRGTKAWLQREFEELNDDYQDAQGAIRHEKRKVEELEKENRILTNANRSKDVRNREMEGALRDQVAKESERMVQDLVHRHGLPLVDAIIRVEETLTAFSDRKRVREDRLEADRRAKDFRNGNF